MEPIEISLFWEDGFPAGIRTAAIPGQTASAIAGPRDRISTVLERPGLSKPGVYILSGYDEDDQMPCVYIGESGDIAARIRSHLHDHNKGGKKKFWEQTFLITSSDAFFTKAHALYVESELIRTVKKANRIRLRQVQPNQTKLHPGGEVLAKTFLRFLESVLPAMGLDLLEPDMRRPPPKGNNEPIKSPKDARKAFWEALLATRMGKFDLFTGVSPSSNPWITKKKFGFAWAFVVLADALRVELYLNSAQKQNNKDLFDQLFEDRATIEEEFGGCLFWERLPDKKVCRISHKVRGGLEDTREWPAIMEYAVNVMQRLFKALGPRVESFSAPGPTPIESSRQDFWNLILAKRSPEFDLFSDVTPSNLTWIAKGRHGCRWEFVVTKKATRAELRLNSTQPERNKALFDGLYSMRESIEQEFGGHLNWHRLDDKSLSKITREIPGGLDDSAKWDTIVESAWKAMEGLYRVFEQPIVDFNKKWVT